MYILVEDDVYSGNSNDIVQCGVVGFENGIEYSKKRELAIKELNEILYRCNSIEDVYNSIEQSKRDLGLQNDFKYTYCGYVAVGVYLDANEVHWWVRED